VRPSARAGRLLLIFIRGDALETPGEIRCADRCQPARVMHNDAASVELGVAPRLPVALQGVAKEVLRARAEPPAASLASHRRVCRLPCTGRCSSCSLDLAETSPAALPFPRRRRRAFAVAMALVASTRRRPRPTCLGKNRLRLSSENSHPVVPLDVTLGDRDSGRRSARSSKRESPRPPPRSPGFRCGAIEARHQSDDGAGEVVNPDPSG
jgi:hypothetical protein